MYGITYSSLDVEDTGITPAMLIITNQSSVGVCGKSGLAGTRKTEKHSDITILALIRGRMEGENVVLYRHFIEENGENTLLHLTSILSTQDDHLLLSEVDGDGRSRGHALSVSVGRERTGVVDGVVGVEMLKFFWIGSDKHVAHEKSVVGTSADDSDLDLVLLVPSCITIDNVNSISRI